MTARRRVHPLIRELAEHRQTLDLTRPEAADLAGISRSTIAALETGQCSPRLAVLEDLAHALGFRVALIQIDEKQCRTCREVKPLRRFARDSRRADGFSNHCGSCQAAGSHTPTPVEDPGHRAKIANLTESGRAKGRAIANALRAAERDDRLAEFIALRNEGLSVREAGERLGIHRETARRYEVRWATKQNKQGVAA